MRTYNVVELCVDEDEGVMTIVVYAVFVVQILVLTRRVEVNGVNDGRVSTAVDVPVVMDGGILALDDPVESGRVALEGPVESGTVAVEGSL
jgi:hypothetical protein